jgi:hypothetical protein
LLNWSVILTICTLCKYELKNQPQPNFPKVPKFLFKKLLKRNILQQAVNFGDRHDCYKFQQALKTALAKF